MVPEILNGISVDFVLPSAKPAMGKILPKLFISVGVGVT